uniref:Uncharacterized protein n=1 Tax=Arundo donax TaxID=35708 RepID=A0A0A9ESF3_ARUDO
MDLASIPSTVQVLLTIPRFTHTCVRTCNFSWNRMMSY